ncbi:hypothetical protein [Nocardia wallacei]|uniref:hypothetical protein n=1 Tax=Nocardia wallacei TaxID=480035 RepID=UPI0024587C04|nr:hypothetical protein [Nocardia wallacei]
MPSSPEHSPGPGGRELPPTPLMLIRERFTALADHRVSGLPPRWDEMSAAALAARLLDPQTPADEVDAVWAQLIEQARTREETAVLVCAGAALPMLHTIAGKLCGHPGYRADTEAMVLVAFLDAVAEVDVTRPSVAYRLRWATFNRSCPPVRERQRAPIPVEWNEASKRSRDGQAVGSPDGHPELLLALAVDEGVLTADDARLIGATRLEHRPLKTVAAEAGIGYAGLAKRRRRAEQRLAAWLRERIVDKQVSTKVETAALDTLTHHADHESRRPSADRMSKTRPRSRVLPVPKSAPQAEHTSHEEARRCA